MVPEGRPNTDGHTVVIASHNGIEKERYHSDNISDNNA
jgi:hypothetical protein